MSAVPQPAPSNADQADGNGKGGWPRDFVLRHRFLLNILIYNVMFASALLIAYLLWGEAGGQLAPWFTKNYLPQLLFFLAGKSIIFGQLKLFRGWWQYAGLRDVANILLGSWIFLMGAYLVVLMGHWLPKILDRPVFFNYSDGVLVLDFMVTVFVVSTAKLGVRLYYEELRPISAEGVRRVLVVGADNAAETLLREISKMRVERYRVIGLVDDDPNKKGISIHAIPVMGTTDDIKEICESERIDEILIAVPSASQKQLRAIVAKCQGTKLNFQALLSMDSLIDGRVTVSQIRQVEIKDLLGRGHCRKDKGRR